MRQERIQKHHTERREEEPEVTEEISGVDETELDEETDKIIGKIAVVLAENETLS